MEKELERLYYTPRNPTAYAGADKLLNATRKKYDPSKVINWLEGQDSHTYHKPVRRRFPRRTYNIYNPGDVLESDLIDLRSLKSYNDGTSYLLVVIDAFSRFAYVEPLLDKTAACVASAFAKILKSRSNLAPFLCQTDGGKEYTGKAMQDFLKKNNIVHRIARDPVIKCSIAERFNRTLKGKLWRFFTHRHTRRYLEVLPDIVKSYNNSWHSGIRMTPAQVHMGNAARVRENLSMRYETHRPDRKPKYNVGDLVRISREKGVFDKAYSGGWSKELFRIKRISTSRQPPVYFLKDLADVDLTGFFYEEELSRVQKDLEKDVFEVDEILRTKGQGRNKKYFVSWLGYGPSFNSWISAADLENL